MNKNELLLKIQQLSFAKCETELFLDTHPDCKLALDYYRKLVDELEPLMAEYQGKYGPIVAGATNGDRWSWIDGPWPWHMEWNENAPKTSKAGGGKK
jgi:spore coat protein JB